MLDAPVQSSSESSSATEVSKDILEERETPCVAGGEGGLPSVQPWEQLSHYEGFKTEPVQAGMAASLSMFIAHTQQVFVLRSGRDLTLQVRYMRVAWYNMQW